MTNKMNLLSSDEPKSKKDKKKKKKKRKGRKGGGSSEEETVPRPSVDTTTGEMPEVRVFVHCFLLLNYPHPS